MQRFIPPCLALAVLLAAAAFAFDPTAPTAHACSIVTPNDARFADTVDRSPIVAIGHWEDSKERTVTFVVDQPLKGAGEGERLQVDNRTTYTAMACSPYDEPFREGYRFVPGERAVLLLEKQVDGLWQVAYLSLAAFEVPSSFDAGMDGVGWYFGDPEAGTPTDVRLRTVVEAAGFEGAVSLNPAARLSGGEPLGTPVSSAPRTSSNEGPSAQADAGPGWPGLAMGVVLFAAPIAWRWRR